MLATGDPRYFYPRSPCGERPVKLFRQNFECFISIHALLAESDWLRCWQLATRDISIHALLAESDCIMTITTCTVSKFLSTLSLRRATHANLGRHRGDNDFYPRSPCGERHYVCQSPCCGWLISIHALLAESDLSGSTKPRARRISIHALLAESDNLGCSIKCAICNFYPRSPCGERHLTKYHFTLLFIFLSTLSLRRATCCGLFIWREVLISIHALLAESDKVPD